MTATSTDTSSPAIRTGAVRPFALCALLGALVLALPPYEHDLTTLTLAGLLVVAVVAAAVLLPWERWPPWTHAVAPMAFFGVIVVVRESAGGASSGLGPLVALPVLWFALYGTRRQLQASGVVTALVFVGPLLLEGAPAYPAEEWRRAAVWLAVVWTVAPAVQEVVRRLRESENRWRLLLDELPDTVVLTVDQDLRYDVVAGAGALREGVQGWRGQTLQQTSTPDNVAVLAPAYQAALRGERSHVELYATRSGAPHEVTVAPFAHDGAPGALVVARDVSAAQRREREIRGLRDQVERLVEQAPAGVCVASSDGRITRVNTALCELLGRPASDLLGRPLEEAGLRGPHPWAQVVADLASRPGRRDTWEGAVVVEGREVDLSVQAALLEATDGSAALLLLHVVDVSERRTFERRLEHLAGHDPLTGLANRRRFDRALAEHLEMCRRYGPRGSLLMVDLDRFKDVNDALGHDAGDQLIIGVGELFRRELRDSDVVARLGGDEFAVLLPEQSVEEATTVAERLVRLVREELATFDPRIPAHVTASIGLLVLNDAEATVAEVMSTADLTMYDAKDAGRDRVVVFDSADTDMPRSGAQLRWTTRLRRAVEEDRFVLHAQPVVDLRTRHLEAVELLIRLRDDDDVLVMPDRFLYIAERIGLSARIDLWVLEQALEALAAPGGPERVAVNVSARSLDDPKFVESTVQMVQSAELARGRLTIELTETAAIASMHRARAFADAVRRAGCWLALDDFGAGYGSFYYLKHLPFDVVKIDGEFVRGALEDAADRSIIEAVVSVAHGIGGVVVAEHVPDEPTAQLLTQLGVDYGQGYYFGRPGALALETDTDGQDQIAGYN